MYLGIFFSISLAMSMQGKESEKSFEKEKISFCLFDEDHSEISEGLATFLKSENKWVEVADDEELIQEKLYQRNITCVVRIPKGFGEREKKTTFGSKRYPAPCMAKLWNKVFMDFCPCSKGILQLMNQKSRRWKKLQLPWDKRLRWR